MVEEYWGPGPERGIARIWCHGGADRLIFVVCSLSVMHSTVQFGHASESVTQRLHDDLISGILAMRSGVRGSGVGLQIPDDKNR